MVTASVAADSRREDLVSGVLSWWTDARRARDELPWRASTDPWAVLVSEVMLAQTQVSRVGPYFVHVMARFPTPSALADAPAGELLREWSGLGYNRRALALHRAAGMILTRHGGAVPSDLGELLLLPGVGPYIARAVLAIAFGQAVSPVDTNVARVLARAVAGQALSIAQAQRLGDELVPPTRARDWAVAAIDFGSLVCQAREPRCPTCPVASSCSWHIAGRPRDPARDSGHRPRPQARFEGSDREIRGRIVRAACEGPIPAAQLPGAAGLEADPARAHRIVADLVAQGLLLKAPGGDFLLP